MLSRIVSSAWMGVVALAWMAPLGCSSSGGDAEEESTPAESDLVGGKPDLRWAASGYLASGSSMGDLDRSKPACGATLIAPNVVVTAAHCILDEHKTFAFGTGDTGSGPLVRVAERHIHPKFHAEAQGSIDLVHALRKYDVAYLVLEKAVDFAEPAELADEAPSSGCTIQAIGYRASSGGKAVRASTPACVMFRLTLGTDPIFEVHPAENSALCVADGDEGSAVVSRSAEGRTKLVGFFVGSVTQGVTDCVRGTQFLNGYESAFGYRDFFREGIANASSRLGH